MKEISKKLSFLDQLDNILYNNYVNNEVYEYTFNNMKTVILNNIQYDTSDYKVHIVLYLDELILELYKNGKVCKSYSLPYIFVEDIHLIEGD